MACFSPLKAWKIGLTENGKDKLLVTSYNIDFIKWLPDGRIVQCKDDDAIYKSSDSNVQTHSITIPCGSCIGCRLERSKQWASRCLLEMQYHASSYFLTLTYDDLHLPSGSGVMPDTGEVIETHSLVKRDWQLFMKRLRKAHEEKYPGSKLRFFMCGEYGDHTCRPHYHAIVFGLRLDDLVPYKRSGDYWYYNSAWLQDLWPYGFAVVGEASKETAAYTARYCTKKFYGEESQVYNSLNLEPPFVLMSRKPGIGFQYLVDHLDKCMSDDFINIATDRKGEKFRVPKYFKKKFDAFFDEDDVVYLNQRYERKQEALDQMDQLRSILCSQSDNSYLDLLASEEVVLRSKLKQLERSL